MRCGGGSRIAMSEEDVITVLSDDSHQFPAGECEYRVEECLVCCDHT